ncbi:AraC family transcriptional regulator [uncultured Sunxiuqinia sp.]|uniref:helix-turn-helix domain-containing protein n=1 Tax=uncultured Sunxiuqinia sp. TaxID=1573825 RepID=UPI0026286B9D|nr:AraC family transcriptional regulator [uncultured Sunxiuqinia sp.]
MIIEKTYNPSFPLNQYVDLIWIGKASELEMSSSHHAALFTELIFNYGDKFEIEGQNVENLASSNGHQILSGLKTSPFQTKIFGTYGNVGLILKPFCYGMLTKKFGSKAMDNISAILFEQLFVPTNPDFERVEQHLLKIFEVTPIDNDLAKFESYISKNLLEKGSLKDFNMSISISQKSFIQKFKKHFLLTPSEYIKLKQVNYAIQLLQNKDSEKLINIGLDSGFYDQSHFIRVFKKFCGVTPKQFLNG